MKSETKSFCGKRTGVILTCRTSVPPWVNSSVSGEKPFAARIAFTCPAFSTGVPLMRCNRSGQSVPFKRAGQFDPPILLKTLLGSSKTPMKGWR